MDGDRSSSSSSDEEETFRQFCANGKCVKASEIEAKLDKGSIEAAESSLKDGLSINSEEARAFLARLEYQRGKVDSALRVLDGVDLSAVIQRLQSDKQSSKKGSDSQRTTGLILQAIYIKAKCLQKRRKVTEAAKECKQIIEAVEKIFSKGIPKEVDSKLQDTVSHAAGLYPELLWQTGSYGEAVAAYRRALHSDWNLDSCSTARVQKGLAVMLLYSGVEASPPSSAAKGEGTYVPKNNLEEAILLLMIALRKVCLRKSTWDPSVLEHLTFALSLCSQTSVLAKQLEEIMPGILHRVDRWNTLALSFSGEGKNKVALNLLRKSLNKHEKPDDLIALLLAAKICSEDCLLAGEGVGYAQRAVDNAQGKDEHMKGVGLHVLGLCLGKQAKASSSDFDRSRCQAEALKSLDGALALESNNLDLIYELGVQFAEQRNLNAALRCAKKFIDATGGSLLKGWRLLALILSAQQRFSESVVVTDAALEETARWDQGPLLRLKAKLKVSQSRPTDAIETYRYLLGLVQGQKKSFGPNKSSSQIQECNVSESEVWHGLASLYSSLSHYNDAEVCLGKVRDLNKYSAEVLHMEGKILEGQGSSQEALSSYMNALMLQPSYVPCKIMIGALLSETGSKTMPVAKSILSDALRLEPTNRMAWYYLGVVHRNDGRMVDAADCFQAAAMLEESDPIESFSSIC